MELLKSVAVQEAGLLKSLANKLTGKKDEEEPDTSNLKYVTQLGENETASQRIIDEVFSVPSGHKRGVLFLNGSELKSQYFRGKGNEVLANAMDDNTVLTLFSTQNGKPFVIIPGEFDLSALSAAPASKPYALLVNVPDKIAQRFMQGGSPSVKEARQFLTQAISHDNYIGVLNVPAIKKAKVGDLKNPEDREDKFNIPDFVSAYREASIIEQAREEWDAAPAKNTEKAINDVSLELDDAARDALKIINKYEYDTGWPQDTNKVKKELKAALFGRAAFRGKQELLHAVEQRFMAELQKLRPNVRQKVLQILDFDGQAAKDAEAAKAAADQQNLPPEEKKVSDLTADEVASHIAKRGNDFIRDVERRLKGFNSK